MLVGVRPRWAKLGLAQLQNEVADNVVRPGQSGTKPCNFERPNFDGDHASPPRLAVVGTGVIDWLHTEQNRWPNYQSRNSPFAWGAIPHFLV